MNPKIVYINIGNLKEGKILGENILNSVLGGQTYSYSALKAEWNKVKNNPYNENYGFLISIFGFDKGKETKSQNIFAELAALDGESDPKTATLGVTDIKKLSAKKVDPDVPDSSFNTISVDDFEEMYKAANVNVDNDSIQSIREQNSVYTFDPNAKKYMGQDESTQRLQQKVDDAINKIMWSKAGEAQKYKKLLRQIGTENIKIDSIEHGYAAQTFIGTPNAKDSIHLNVESEQNFDDKILMKNLLHELNHYEDGDFLSSITEERDCEKQALKDARAILKLKSRENIFKTMPDGRHLAEFTSPYKAKYPKYSPGHGLPQDIGLAIIDANDENTSARDLRIDWQGNVVTITNKRPNFMQGIRNQKYIVTYGPNGHPINAKRVEVVDRNGKLSTETYSYGEYDPKKKMFIEGKTKTLSAAMQTN